MLILFYGNFFLFSNYSNASQNIKIIVKNLEVNFELPQVICNSTSSTHVRLIIETISYKLTPVMESYRSTLQDGWLNDSIALSNLSPRCLFESMDFIIPNIVKSMRQTITYKKSLSLKYYQTLKQQIEAKTQLLQGIFQFMKKNMPLHSSTDTNKLLLLILIFTYGIMLPTFLILLIFKKHNLE